VPYPCLWEALEPVSPEPAPEPDAPEGFVEVFDEPLCVGAAAGSVLADASCPEVAAGAGPLGAAVAADADEEVSDAGPAGAEEAGAWVVVPARPGSSPKNATRRDVSAEGSSTSTWAAKVTGPRVGSPPIQ